MYMKKSHLLLCLLLLCSALPLLAQKQRIKNIPYSDQRRFHYGFCLGLNMSDMILQHEGTDIWAEDPDANASFCVGLLGDVALTEHLNVRCTPMLFFQQRQLQFVNVATGEHRTQALKTNYLELPISLKVATHRVNNYRPYLLAGLGIDMDLSHEKETPIVFNRMDLSLHAAIGCDTYLPFFKFCPELRFHLGLLNMLDKKRKDLKDQTLMPYTDALQSARNKGLSLIFFFE